MTAYDSSSDARPFDETFGTLGAYLKIWGEKDTSGRIKPTYFKKLETRPCTKEDINLNGEGDNDNFLFFAPSEEFNADANRFYSKLNCLINDDAELQGDYNSARATQLVIRYEICVDEPSTPIIERKCKDYDDIKQWLNRKFLLTMENQITFQKDEVEDKKLSKSSRLVWNVLSPQQR